MQNDQPSTVKPFKGLRPDPALVSRVASVPYDVVSREEAKQLANNNSCSFLHVVRSDIDLPDNVSPYAEEAYTLAKDNLNRLINDGILTEDPEEQLYIYRLKRNEHIQTGIIGAVAVAAYKNGKIKVHEKTRVEKLTDRTRHMEVTQAHTGPVILTYKTDPQIKTLTNEAIKSEPIYDFEADDGVQHTVWIANNSNDLANAFDNVSSFYIADGHHRAESSKLCSESLGDSHPEANCFLSVIFPDSELTILPYNRVLKNLPDGGLSALIEKLSPDFLVNETTAATPGEKGEICMYVEGQWYLLKRKELAGKLNPVEDLDASILQNTVLKPLFGIDDPRTSDMIEFVGGIRGTEELERLVNSKQFQVAFSMYPVSVNDLIQVSDAGEIMPPKSTWFEPKMCSGLLTHRF